MGKSLQKPSIYWLAVTTDLVLKCLVFYVQNFKIEKPLFFLLSPHNCLPGVARMSERYKSRTQEVLTLRGPEGDQKGEEEQEKTDKLRTMIEILQEKLAKVYTSTFTYVCLRLFLESPFRTVLNVFFFSTKRQNSSSSNNSSNSSAKPTEGSTWSQRTGNISKPPLQQEQQSIRP